MAKPFCAAVIELDAARYSSAEFARLAAKAHSPSVIARKTPKKVKVVHWEPSKAELSASASVAPSMVADKPIKTLAVGDNSLNISIIPSQKDKKGRCRNTARHAAKDQQNGGSRDAIG